MTKEVWSVSLQNLSFWKAPSVLCKYICRGISYCQILCDRILLYKTFLPFKYLYQTFMFSPLWSVIRRSTSGIEFPTMSGTNNEWARVSLFEYNTYLYSIEIHLLSKQLKDRCCHFSCAFFPKLFGFTCTLQKIATSLNFLTESHHKLPNSQNMSAVPTFLR